MIIRSPMPHKRWLLNDAAARVQMSGNCSPAAPMATHLEIGTYLLDTAERQAFTIAARMVERVDHRQLDLAQPLAEFDYLLLMCAHLIVTGEENVDDTIVRIVDECLEERRRHTC